ncbi:MAG: hypothetical protein R3B70_32980 [Polyangiaceae bacterium]
MTGGSVLETDPAVQAAGVDIGFSDKPTHLRAPDVSVGDIPNEPGWAATAPPLAVEYADRGQDEKELKAKIEELLGAGTRFLWVVRLTGPRRVEVHEPGKATRVAKPGEHLLAPGILQNPVPVNALYDREAAHEATLRNLLQRQGYESLEAALAESRREGKLEGKAEGQAEGKLEGKLEGKAEGKAEGELEGELRGRAAALLAVLAAREIPVDAAQRQKIEAARDKALLDTWIARAAVVASAEEALSAEPKKARDTVQSSLRSPRRKGS